MVTREARRTVASPIPRKRGVLVLLLGCLLGSRIVYVGFHTSYYASHLLESVEIWKGGLAWPGAIAGGLLGLVAVACIWRIPIAMLADRLIPLASPLAIAVWIGCWLSGVAYGFRPPPGRKAIRVQIHFCQTCGKRVPESDLQSGAATADEENHAFCPKCASSRLPAKRATGSVPPSARAPRRTSAVLIPEARAPSPHGPSARSAPPAAVRSSFPALVLGGGVAFVAVLGGLLLLLLGGPARNPTRPKSEKPAPHAPVSVAPKTAPPTAAPIATTPGPASSPVPPPTPTPEPSNTIDDIREGLAKRQWTELKAELDGKGSADWMLRGRLKEFASGYGSTRPGKEAAEYLARLRKDEPAPPTDEQVFAGYRRDFRAESPAEGWRFCWNAKGPVGDPANYLDLVWNPETKGYAAKADKYPDSPPAHYVVFRADTAHPGAAYGGAAGVEHYAIAALRVPERVRGACALWCRLNRPGNAGTKGTRTVDLRVYVNTALKESFILDGRMGECERVIPLGALSADETVYFAVGPAGDCGSDSTQLDFKLYTMR